MKEMDGNLQKYEAFLKTVETGSFTKAAEALSYTQSSVSKMISDLEKEWGVVLLTRDRGGVELTSTGMELLPAIRTLVEDFRRVGEQVDELNGLQSGTVRVGVFSSVATHWMPNILKAFQKDYPGIDFELLMGDYSEVEQWISDGRVDCGFLRLPTRPEFETISLERDDLKVVLPKGHTLCNKTRIAPEDLEGDAFLLLEHGGKTEISEYLDAQNVHPNVKFTTWDDYAIMSMVESGLGIAILPSLILKRIPYDIEVRPLKVPAYREIGLALKGHKTASPATRAFLEYLIYRNM